MSYLKAKKNEEECTRPVVWLVIFTDVIALLLTFFVLLYSMSMPIEEKWTEMTSALNTEFNKFYSVKWNEGSQDTISIDKLDYSSALDLEYLKVLVEELVSEDASLQQVKLILQSDHLIISMPSDLLFDPGQANVKERGSKALFALGGVLARIRNRIEIVGHTDPRPLTGTPRTYNDNWDLSLARALQVGTILENVGYKRDMTIRGVSSARYDELPLGFSEAMRLDLARRVDIVIMEDDGGRRRILNMGLF